MTSVLDILINEVAKVLGITPDEVKKKFTEQELEDLLNSSLCEPLGDVGVPFDDPAPCDDLAVPNLLPPIEDLEKQLDAIKPNEQEQNNVKKCIDKVEETNKIIEAQIDLYNRYRILHDKLLEYRDNYFPVAVYYDERAKEAARILKVFEPILTELRRLEQVAASLQAQYNAADSQVTQLYNAYANSGTQPAYNAYQQAYNLRATINTKIQVNSTAIGVQQSRLRQAEQTIPIFSNSYYREVFDNLDNSYYINLFLGYLFNDIFSYSQISSALFIVNGYAEGLNLAYTGQRPTSLSDIFEKTYFKFDLQFPNLDYIRTQKEKFNGQTGDSYTETFDHQIQTSPLLQNTSFFQTNNSFLLRNFPLENRSLPSGQIYQNYYNLFEDPVNNFFTLEERGLTSNVNLVDPNLKGTGGETKKEKNAEYFIQNLETLQNFYKDFDARFELKKVQKRAQNVDPVQNSLRTTMGLLAKREVQAVLALSRVSQYLPTEDQGLQSAITKFNAQNQFFVQRLADLDSEIARVKMEMDKLKPDPLKIRKLLKEKSPECFEKIDNEILDDPNADCAGARAKLGSDPFFINSIKGCDPTLPNQNQLCYWFEFSKLATLVGLLPIPNAAAPPQLRYWPVGLIIPYPAGLIKIPLPIIWIPLVVFSTPLGNVVLFLTINGVFISPVVFFVSSSGFKQHILTIKGPSKKFGYTAEDATIKPGIQFPAKLLALKAKADRLAKEASLGVDYALSAKEKADKLKQATVLSAAESAANLNNNDIRKSKVKREKTNFQRATRNITDAEKLAEIVDKTDSLKDIIDDAKHAILNRIDELGRPGINKVNALKNKITDRQGKLLSQLQSALVGGNDAEVARIREELAKDGISLDDKITAIKGDMLSYFNKIKLPKITIPKDASTIDPKLNALVEFLLHIKEFASIYRTQFFSKDDSKVQKILAVQLARHKPKIKKEIAGLTSTAGTLDINAETQKVKDALKKTTSTVLSAATGTLNTGSATSQKQKADEIKEKIKKEGDPAKRAKLRTDLQKAQVALSDAFDNERIKFALSLTPVAIASLSQISVDFNPFAPCCKKKSFSLDLGISPAIPVFESAKLLLNAYIDSLSKQDLIALFGGKTKISAQDITGAYLGIIKRSIPASLEIPIPNLNLLTFATSFSGILAALFEIKVPNVAAQPALPISITIDLNLLKGPLLELFLKFIENSLPDPTGVGGSGTPPPSPTQQTSPIQVQGNSGLVAGGVSTITPVPQTKASLDKDISIVTCDPPTTEDSVLGGGALSASNPPTATGEEGGGAINVAPTTKSSNFSSGNVIVNSKKDVLPNFQTLDIDFLSVNPSDLLAIIKNFIDLKFEELQALLDPFYNLLKVVQGLKGTNLNLLESIQYKAPPYGPPAEIAFIAITNLKKQIPKSATLKIVDPIAVENGAKLLQTALAPIANSPLPAIVVAVAGAVDALLPAIKAPSVDTQTGAIATKDLRAASFALRSIHPLLSQDDLPPWERLTVKNLLFLLFVDEFVANGADKLGFFRSFV